MSEDFELNLGNLNNGATLELFEQACFPRRGPTTAERDRA